MRDLYQILVHAWLLTLPVMALTAQDPEPAEPPGPPLVVHEWGTFTSLQGSDGIALEGLHHEEEALPAFVHDLGGLRELPDKELRKSKFPASRVTQKMETPVVYFYTDVPQRARVEVTFVGGLLTQFFPLPETVAPPLGKILEKLAESPIDIGGIRMSSLGWDVELTPFGGEPPAEIPVVDLDDPWHYARQVRAAYVRTVPNEGLERPAEAEHYLFYRGLGRFELPLQVTTDTEGASTAQLAGDAAVPFAVAVDITGTEGAFRVIGPLAPGATDVTVGPDVRRRPLLGVLGGLRVALMTALVEQGLYEDEARAMVMTWSRQWFHTPGHRLLWIVPRASVDQLLPLGITPTPTELVRVLVGRLEFLTPDTESAVARALLDRTDRDPAVRTGAETFLRGLDRFLEPHVRRAFVASEDPAVRASAVEVLAVLDNQ